MENRFFFVDGDFTANELAKFIGSEITGDGDKVISGLATLADATAKDVSFLNNMKYKEEFYDSKAGICIVSKEFVDVAPKSMSLLISNEVYADWARIIGFMYKKSIELQNRPINTEFISSSAIIGEGSTIAPGVVIGDGAIIGSNCYIGANSYIGSGVIIGNNSTIYNNVSIICAEIGDNAIIHSGVRIGQDGFGFAKSKVGVVKVHQIGGVIVGKNVEIGANTCIDRGAIDNTVIGDNTKIDNLVQIGHGVKIGRFCFIAGQAGIAGSTEIGDLVMMGGQAGVAGHIKVASGCNIAAQSGVMKEIRKNGESVGGSPALPLRQWLRQNVWVAKSIKKEDK